MGSYNTGAVFFASCNTIDARPVYDDDSTISAVSSLVKGGVHVSESQCVARNSLTEIISGFHFMAGTDKVRGGLTAAVAWFSLPFLPDTTKSETISAFAGNRLINLAADFKAGTGRLLFFSEAALEYTWLMGFHFRIKRQTGGKGVTWHLLARYFARNYHAFHSGAFSAVSRVSQ